MIYPEALARAQHAGIICPIRHNPKYKSYVPPQDCPVLERMRRDAVELVARYEIEEAQFLADKALSE